MHTSLEQQLRDEAHRLDDIRRMLRLCGKVLATAECGITYYILDGKVWCVRSHTQIDPPEDYFEFMTRMRRTDRYRHLMFK